MLIYSKITVMYKGTIIHIFFLIIFGVCKKRNDQTKITTMISLVLTESFDFCHIIYFSYKRNNIKPHVLKDLEKTNRTFLVNLPFLSKSSFSISTIFLEILLTVCFGVLREIKVYFCFPKDDFLES